MNDYTDGPDLLDLLDAQGDDQGDDIAARFLRFHAANPHVWRVLEEAASRHVARYGVQRTSVDYLVHFARFERITHTEGDEEYRISNGFTPFYARLLLDRHPEWVGLFETRKSIADEGGWLGVAA